MRVGFWFSSVTFRSRVFHSRVFSYPDVDTDEQSSWKLSAFLPNIQNVLTNFQCSQCLCTLLLRYFISSYYSTRFLKSFTAPSVLLTKFLKNFHAKLLASAFIFTKLSTKTLCFDAAVFHLSIKGFSTSEMTCIVSSGALNSTHSLTLCRNTPALFLLLFVNVQASL